MRYTIEDVLDALSTPQDDVEETAERIASGLSLADARRLACDYLKEHMRSKRRAEVLETERAAEREAARRADKDRLDGVPGRRSAAQIRRAIKMDLEVLDSERDWLDQLAAIDNRARDQFHEDLTTTLSTYAAHLKMEWTSELLSSEIALPDGSRTTWGSATIDQHRLRAAMLTKNAITNGEAAARHLHAVAEIESHPGAANLEEALKGVSA